MSYDQRQAPHRPTEAELDALYAAIGTTRQAANLRAQQRDKQPKKKARCTR